ncbi:MAG: signal peptidase II [Anaerolineaceae bacterium]
MKKIHAVLLMILLTALDQAAKAWVVANISLNSQTVLIPNLINLTHIKIPGVSLGMLSSLPEAIRSPLLIGLSSIISIGMLVYLLKNYDSTESYVKIGLAFIIPGAIGNLIDRVLYGHVTDFLQFRWYDIGFFSNNLADIYISAGVVIFLLGMWLGSKKKPDDTSPLPFREGDGG